MSQKITHEAEAILTVNAEFAKKSMEDLRKESERLKKALKEAEDAGDKALAQQLTRQINAVNGSMKSLKTNADNIEAALKSIDKATPKELQKAIRAITHELNSGRIERGSREWDMLTEKLKLTKKELASVKKQMESIKPEGMFKRMFKSFSDWWGMYSLFTDAIEGVSMKLSTMKKQFRDKGESQANLKALTGLDDESVQWLTRQAEQLSQTMDETGLRVTQSSKEILDAYMLVGSNKPELLTDKEALNAVTVETMRLSAASKMKLAPAVDATTTALNQYGAGAEEAAKYVNVLAAGSKFGAANVEQQAASILKAGTAAASAGVPIEQLVGTIEMLGEKGIKGEIAGTGLKKFFLVLQTGAEQTNPKVVGLSTALDNLKAKVDAAEAKSTGGGAALLKKLFGEEAYSVAAILTSNTRKVQEYTDAVTGTSVAIEQAAINSDTLAARKAQLNNKITETGNQLMEKLNPSLGILVSWQTKLIGVLPDVIDFIVKYRKVIITAVAAIAGYTIAVKGMTVAEKATTIAKNLLNNAQKTQIALTKTGTAVYKLASAALYTMTGNTAKARIAMQGFNLACTANPIGAVVTALVVAATTFHLLDDAIDDTAESMEGLNGALETAVKKREDEKAEIKKNITALEEFNGTRDEEKRICTALNEKYGDVLGTYDTTAQWLETLKKRGDEWTESVYNQILAEGKLEVARQMIAEAEKKRAEAQTYDPGFLETFNNLLTTGSDFGFHTWKKAKDIAKERVKSEAEKDAKELEDMARQITAEAEQKLIDSKLKAGSIVGDALKDGDDGKEDPPKDTNRETEEERKERLKKEREAERERQKALKEDLDKEKALHEKQLAEITALYTTGQIDYKEYLDRKKLLDADLLANQKSVYLKHNEEQSSEYAALLRKEQEMKMKHLLEMKKLSEKELEATHTSERDLANSNFYNPDSAVFQNDAVLKQKLLDADVKYLQAKLKLYENEPEKYREIQEELEERLAEDRLEKAKATAQAFMEFQEQYGKQSGGIREQAEISILKNLHDSGLISEEQYKKALAAIKKKYRDADAQAAHDERWKDVEDAYDACNEYDRMIFRLYQSFTDLFENLDTSSEDFWQRLSGAAQATVDTIGTIMGSMKSYTDACMNAEVASIENRYDKEIEAAGKNSVKVAKLEAEREKEVAKTRQKYNKRAMKMEVSQAIAQTATNALGAYGAMVKIPVVGPTLAIAAAAAATATGLIQVATIKKQHEAQSQGYFSGGFTPKHPDNRRETGVVHANEFVANHKAVANPALMPVLRLIDHAQKSNTVGSITAEDVSRAIGRTPGVGAGGDSRQSGAPDTSVNSGLEMIAGVTASTRQSLDRLSSLIEDGLPTYMVMDGENGFHSRYKKFQKTLNRPKV